MSVKECPHRLSSRTMHILRLPNEILVAIIHYTAVDSFQELVKQDGYSPSLAELVPLAATCHALRSLCLPVLARRLDLNRVTVWKPDLTTSWLENVSYLQLHPNDNELLLKVYEQDHLIMTGDSVSLINPRVCPQLKEVETHHLSQLQRLNHALDSFENGYENYKRVTVHLKIGHDSLGDLRSLGRQPRIQSLDISVKVGSRLRMHRPDVTDSYTVLQLFSNIKEVSFRHNDNTTVRPFMQELMKIKTLERFSILLLNEPSHPRRSYRLITQFPRQLTHLTLSLNIIGKARADLSSAELLFPNIKSLKVDTSNLDKDRINYPDEIKGSWIRSFITTNKETLKTVTVINNTPLQPCLGSTMSLISGTSLDTLTLSYPEIEFTGVLPTVFQEGKRFTVRRLVLISRDTDSIFSTERATVVSPYLNEHVLFRGMERMHTLDECIIVNHGIPSRLGLEAIRGVVEQRKTQIVLGGTVHPIWDQQPGHFLLETTVLPLPRRFVEMTEMATSGDTTFLSVYEELAGMEWGDKESTGPKYLVRFKKI